MARHRRGYTGERFTEPLAVKLTPSQRADLERRAEASGLALSAFARAALLGGKVPASGTDRATLRLLVAEIARVGNNVNQLARIANQTGQVRSERALEAVAAQIIDTLQKVVG